MKNATPPRLRSRSLLAILMLVAAAPLASAQVLDRAIPEAAEPGDLVILRGTGLGGTTSVEFTAHVGGFVIYSTKSVAPLAVSDTEVLAIVPEFNAFHPTGADPFGMVRVTPPAGELGLFFMEATSGALTTPGVGTTQASGIGKPVISFHNIGIFGLPVPGSPYVDLRLENATPDSIAVACLSLPAAPPYLPVGNGELVLQGPTLFIVGLGVVNVYGDTSTLVGIPPSASGVFALQWGLIEAGSGQLAVSNGLQVVL